MAHALFNYGRRPNDNSVQLKIRLVVVLRQAIFRGVPVIVLDAVSPVWPVSCHDFSELEKAVTGLGCRFSRKKWLHSLAYTMWNIDDIESGEAFDHIFQYKKKLDQLHKPENDERKDNETVTSYHKNRQTMIHHSYMLLSKKKRREAVAEERRSQDSETADTDPSVQHNETDSSNAADPTISETLTSSSSEARRDAERTSAPEQSEAPSLDSPSEVASELVGEEQKEERTSESPPETTVTSVTAEMKSTVTSLKRDYAIPLQSRDSGNNSTRSEGGHGLPLSTITSVVKSTTITAQTKLPRASMGANFGVNNTEAQRILKQIIEDRARSVRDDGAGSKETVQTVNGAEE